jgi:hypothetical protein
MEGDSEIGHPLSGEIKGLYNDYYDWYYRSWLKNGIKNHSTFSILGNFPLDSVIIYIGIFPSFANTKFARKFSRLLKSNVPINFTLCIGSMKNKNHKIQIFNGPYVLLTDKYLYVDIKEVWFWQDTVMYGILGDTQILGPGITRDRSFVFPKGLYMTRSESLRDRLDLESNCPSLDLQVILAKPGPNVWSAPSIDSLQK